MDTLVLEVVPKCPQETRAYQLFPEQSKGQLAVTLEERWKYYKLPLTKKVHRKILLLYAEDKLALFFFQEHL